MAHTDWNEQNVDIRHGILAKCYHTGSTVQYNVVPKNSGEKFKKQIKTYLKKGRTEIEIRDHDMIRH